MKRLLLGIGLLALLPVLGLWASNHLSDIHGKLSDTLAQAAELALTGAPEEGAALAEQAQQQWEGYWHKVASMADHAPMDEIDGLFAQLKAYAKAGLREDFAAICAQLSKHINAIGEAHSLSWWNLL